MMTRRPTRILVLLLGLCCAGSAFGQGSSGTQQIASVKVHDNGAVSVVGLSDDWKNPDLCGDSSRIVIATGQAGFQNLYAAVMTAHVAERDIKFGLNGCVDVNGRNFPSIRSAVVY